LPAIDVQWLHIKSPCTQQVYLVDWPMQHVQTTNITQAALNSKMTVIVSAGRTPS
jgi:hypothetical protein